LSRLSLRRADFGVSAVFIGCSPPFAAQFSHRLSLAIDTVRAISTVEIYFMPERNGRLRGNANTTIALTMSIEPTPASNHQLQVSLTFLDRATLREPLRAINLYLRPARTANG
jgi:hypothetical protein